MASTSLSDEAPSLDQPDPEEDEFEPEEIPPEEVQVPVLRRSPRNNKGNESTQKEFNHFVKILLTVLNREDTKATYLADKLAYTGKMEEGEPDQPATAHGPPTRPVTRAQARLLITCQDSTKAAQDRPHPRKTLPFLPVLEGDHTCTVWIVTRRSRQAAKARAHPRRPTRSYQGVTVKIRHSPHRDLTTFSISRSFTIPRPSFPDHSLYRVHHISNIHDPIITYHICHASLLLSPAPSRSISSRIFSNG